MKRKALIALGVVVFAAGVYAISTPQALAPYIAVPFTEKGVSVLFAGDAMFDRNVAKRAEGREEGTMWGAKLLELFADTDTTLRVLNLEGTITTNASIARRDSNILRFTFNPQFVRDSIAPLRLSAVSLANNHALDFYDRGYTSTREYLAEWSIAHFGQPFNTAGNLSVRLPVGNKQLCLVGYHELFKSDPASVISEIEYIRPLCWRVIVMPHWGVEYEGTPSSEQRSLAQQFLDAGADAIIGAHPHVVQTVEIYDGKPIFYSLGNFMFDQDFSWDTTHGLLVHVTFLESETRFRLYPTSVVLSQADLAGQEERERILKALVGKELPEAISVPLLAEGAFSLPYQGAQ
jgi:poly-gamma-glutamate synthesis protein (capsule biosynthesis protein)